MEWNVTGLKGVMLPQKALYFPEIHTLVVADIHLGKAAYFQENAYAITDKTEQADMHLLLQLITEYHICKLFILGDLFHHGYHHGRAIFDDFARKMFDKNVSVIWILGNHDKVTDVAYGVQLMERYDTSNIGFIHDASSLKNKNTEDTNKWIISGHEHPAILLKGRSGQLKLPAFIQTERGLILPSFGFFTGHKTYLIHKKNRSIYKQNHMAFYAILKDKVVQVL
jgi:DNA ligase-associated metallophosphoesterase